MILADFQEFIGRGFFGLILLLGIASLGIKNLLLSNPHVKDAAKDAATKKAISMIGKWLK